MIRNYNNTEMNKSYCLSIYNVLSTGLINIISFHAQNSPTK